MNGDIVLLAPSPEQVRKALAAAAANANDKQRVRLVESPNSLEIFEVKEGTYQEDGGAVPNSYNYPATTSYLGYVWWTDRLHRLHVRIVAGRAKASKRPRGIGDGVTKRFWKQMFPFVQHVANVYPGSFKKIERTVVGPRGGNRVVVDLVGKCKWCGQEFVNTLPAWWGGPGCEPCHDGASVP